MKFRCPRCKKIIKRDIRCKEVKVGLTKSGNLRTICSDGYDVIARKVKENV